MWPGPIFMGKRLVKRYTHKTQFGTDFNPLQAYNDAIKITSVMPGTRIVSKFLYDNKRAFARKYGAGPLESFGRGMVQRASTHPEEVISH